MFFLVTHCGFPPQNSLIVGSSPSFDCSDTLSTTDFNMVISESHRAPRPLNGTSHTPANHNCPSNCVSHFSSPCSDNYFHIYIFFHSGGRSGICWPTFGSSHNSAPLKPHHINNNYNAIKGLLRVTGEFLSDQRSYSTRLQASKTTPDLFSRHNVCWIQRRLLWRDKRDVHDQPHDRGPAAPCGGFRPDPD